MAYSIRELSDLAGVSARTLRYYDEIGLLRPLYTNSAGIRHYGEREVMLLQQILFYRERGFGLKQIQQMVYQEGFDMVGALEEHLLELERQRERMDRLIGAVRKTLASMKGECTMSDQEKFEALKEKAVKENEGLYGKEIRQAYGDAAIDGANKKILGMSMQDWEYFKHLEEEIKEKLKEGVRAGIAASSEEARAIVSLHKEWLCMAWKEYTKEAHKGVAAMYTVDGRFQNYYDAEVPGCAKLLKEAVGYWV